MKIVLLCLVILCSTTYAQDDRVKVAESYEQSGDLKNAARLWLDLYNSNNSSKVYFQGVVRTLKQLGNYSSILPLIDQQLQKRKTAELLALKGDMLFKSGKVQEAEKIWNEALDLSPFTADNVQFVLGAQIENRLTDKSIKTILTAREKLKSSSLFADLLSQLYSANGDFVNGVNECISFFQLSGDVNNAQGRLSAFMLNDSAKLVIEPLLRELSANNRNNFMSQRLFLWFLRETKSFDKALELVITMDKIQNRKGAEILQFADQSRFDNENQIALKAYSILIEQFKDSPYAMNALYGYARVMESSFQESSQKSSNEINGLISRYSSILRQFPNTDISANALYRISQLQLDFLDDIPAAIESLEQLIKQYNRFPIVGDAVVDLGRIYIRLQKLDKAEKTFQKALVEFSPWIPNLKEKALYYLGEVAFFTNDFEKSKEYYAQVTTRMESEFANDAIEKATLITLNNTDTLALQKLSLALLLQFQKQFDKASIEFTSLALNKSLPDLAELGAYKSCECLLMQKNFSATTDCFNKYAQSFPEGIYTDRVLMALASMNSEIGNKAQAMQLYNDLLSKFPRSILVQEAREKIKKIRATM